MPVPVYTCMSVSDCASPLGVRTHEAHDPQRHPAVKSGLLHRDGHHQAADEQQGRVLQGGKPSHDLRG